MKKFRPNPVFDHNLHPVPPGLKKSLDWITTNFFDSRTRNLDIMDTSECKLYGHLTNYEGSNFCWMQPSQSNTNETDPEYDQYIRKVNREARHNRLECMLEAQVGMDCVARYEEDGNWYRAIIIDEPIDNKWLVCFIDYGNRQRCSIENIARPIVDGKYDHFRIPLQAVCCRLYNVSPKLPSFRTELDARLEQLYLDHTGQIFELIVRNKRPDCVVDVDMFFVHDGLTTATERLHRNHIAQDIVDDGIALFVSPENAHTSIKQEVKREAGEGDPRADVKRENDPTVHVEMQVEMQIEVGVKEEKSSIVKKEENLNGPKISQIM